MPTQTLASESVSTLEVLRIASGRYGIGHLDNVALQVWHAPADESAALEIARIADQMYETYPGGISSIHWPRHGKGLPTPKVRKLLAATMKKHMEWTGEVVAVLEGDGFWAGAVRGMLTGIRMAAGKRAGLRIAASMSEVVTWLPEVHHRRTGVRISGAAILAAMDELVERSR